MKVANFMQKSPVSVTEDRPIREAVRLIYNFGVSAVLVTKEKKLVGIITETDILHHLFPSVRDLMEDYVGSRDFDAMEQNMADILVKPVASIMIKKVVSVGPETPIMQAQSTMFLRKFSHIPVVDSEMKLVGIVSQGDIFRALASEKIPHETEEEYHDWLAGYYDLVIQKKKRPANEIESLAALFKKHNVKRIMDVGCGTGWHAIGLAKRGFEVLGIDRSRRMYRGAQKKYEGLSEHEKNRVMFQLGESDQKMLAGRKREFDAAIFMGNALAHKADLYKTALTAVSASLKDKAMLILHLINTKRVFEKDKRLQDFNVAVSNFSPNREYAFVEFYDPPRGDAETITLTMAILQYNGKRWVAMGVNSTPLVYLTPVSATALLTSLGFNRVGIYGSNYGDGLFDKKFDSAHDEWFTVVARR